MDQSLEFGLEIIKKFADLAPHEKKSSEFYIAYRELKNSFNEISDRIKDPLGVGSNIWIDIAGYIFTDYSKTEIQKGKFFAYQISLERLSYDIALVKKASRNVEGLIPALNSDFEFMLNQLHREIGKKIDVMDKSIEDIFSPKRNSKNSSEQIQIMNVFGSVEKILAKFSKNKKKRSSKIKHSHLVEFENLGIPLSKTLSPTSLTQILILLSGKRLTQNVIRDEISNLKRLKRIK